VKIAKRGPAKTWISLEPGYRVLDSKSGIVVEYEAPRRDS